MRPATHKRVAFVMTLALGLARTVAIAQSAAEPPASHPVHQSTQLDLAKPFHTRSPWRFVVTEGPPTKDFGENDAPGALTLCLHRSLHLNIVPTLAHWCGLTQPKLPIDGAPANDQFTMKAKETGHVAQLYFSTLGKAEPNWISWYLAPYPLGANVVPLRPIFCPATIPTPSRSEAWIDTPRGDGPI